MLVVQSLIRVNPWTAACQASDAEAQKTNPLGNEF